MLIIPRPLFRAMIDAAERAFPQEACGLLIGHGQRRMRVTRVEASPNLAQDPCRGFEIDPALRFRLMRDLAESKERLLGHYHSHPDGLALPSATDLSMALEPEFVWIITGVFDGQALMTTAHRLNAAARTMKQLQVILE